MVSVVLHEIERTTDHIYFSLRDPAGQGAAGDLTFFFHPDRINVQVHSFLDEDWIKRPGKYATVGQDERDRAAEVAAILMKELDIHLVHYEFGKAADKLIYEVAVGLGWDTYTNHETRARMGSFWHTDFRRMANYLLETQGAVAARGYILRTVMPYLEEQ